MSELIKDVPLVNSFTYQTIEEYKGSLLTGYAYKQLQARWTAFSAKEKQNALSKTNKCRATWISYYKIESLINSHRLIAEIRPLGNEASPFANDKFKVKALSILLGEKLVREINSSFEHL